MHNIDKNWLFTILLTRILFLFLSLFFRFLLFFNFSRSFRSILGDVFSFFLCFWHFSEKNEHTPWKIYQSNQLGGLMIKCNWCRDTKHAQKRILDQCDFLIKNLISCFLYMQPILFWEIVSLFLFPQYFFLEESLSNNLGCGDFSPEPDCSLLISFIFMIGINMGNVSIFSSFRLCWYTLLLFNKIPSHWHAYYKIHLFLLSVFQWVWQLVLHQNQKQLPQKIQIPLKCLKSWKFPRKYA